MSKIVLNKASTLSFNKAFQREKKINGSTGTKTGLSRSNSRKVGEKNKISKYEPNKQEKLVKRVHYLSESVSGSQNSQNVSLGHGPECNSLKSERLMATSLQSKLTTVVKPTLRSVYDLITNNLISQPKPEATWTLRSFSPLQSGPSKSVVGPKSFREHKPMSSKGGPKKASSPKKQWKTVATSASTLLAESQMNQFKQSLAVEFREAVNRCLTKEKSNTGKKSRKTATFDEKAAPASVREYQLKGIHKLNNFFDQDPVLKHDKEQYRSSLHEFKKVATSQERRSTRSSNDRFKIKSIIGNPILHRTWIAGYSQTSRRHLDEETGCCQGIYPS